MIATGVHTINAAQNSAMISANHTRRGLPVTAHHDPDTEGIRRSGAIPAPLGSGIKPGNPAHRFVDPARTDQLEGVQWMDGLRQRPPHRRGEAIERRPAIRRQLPLWKALPLHDLPIGFACEETGSRWPWSGPPTMTSAAPKRKPPALARRRLVPSRPEVSGRRRPLRRRPCPWAAGP